MDPGNFHRNPAHLKVSDKRIVGENLLFFFKFSNSTTVEKIGPQSEHVATGVDG